jgi:hypothetical protein
LPLLDILRRLVGIPGPRKDVVEVALNGVVETVNALPRLRPLCHSLDPAPDGAIFTQIGERAAAHAVLVGTGVLGPGDSDNLVELVEARIMAS